MNSLTTSHSNVLKGDGIIIKRSDYILVVKSVLSDPLKVKKNSADPTPTGLTRSSKTFFQHYLNNEKSLIIDTNPADYGDMYLCVYIYVYIYTYRRAHAHAYTHTHTHTHTYTYTYNHMHMYMHILIHILTHVHVHVPNMIYIF